MVTCSRNAVRSKIAELIKLHKDDLENGITEGFLGDVFKDYENNSIALGIIRQLFKRLDIDTTVIDRLIKGDHRHMILPELRGYSIESIEDSNKVFKTNYKALTKIQQSFNKEAFKHCILNNSKNAVNHIVSNDIQLSENIAEFKNNLLYNIISIVSEVSPNIEEMLKNKYEVDDILDLKVFTASGNYIDLYYDIMTEVSNVLLHHHVTPSLLSTIDPDKIGTSVTFNILSNLVQLVNFDSMLDNYLEGIIRSDKKLSGEVGRVNYSLITSASEDSQLDLMGVADHVYENALNFVSPQVLKIISIIPKVTLRLNNTTEKLSYSKDSDTLSIPDLFLATSWLQLYLPTLLKYLNIDNIDLLGDPIGVLHNTVREIRRYITLDYSLPLDTRESTSFSALKYSKDAHKQMRKLIKRGGNNIITLLSLYEFLFNEENRLDKYTIPIVEINRREEFDVPINVMGDIARQMASTVAPAFIEYNMDGTIWDKSKKSPISSNYIQKALTSKIGFSLRSDLRTFVLHECLSDTPKSRKAEILTTVTGSIGQALENKAYLETVGEIFNITDNSQLLIFKDLLKDIQDEIDLKSLFEKTGKIIEDIKKQVHTYPSHDKLYNDINRRVHDAVSNLSFDVFEQALSPILGSSPTPTFVDAKGNQLGVYRTTSLVFMIDRLLSKYKQDTNEGMAIGDVPLRKRSNIFAYFPELLQKRDNSLYLANIAIPLSLNTLKGPEEARKLPGFIQDLHAFVGEYLSLMSTKRDSKSEPMVGLQLGAYSDKGTMPQLIVNLEGTSNIHVDLTSTKFLSFKDLLFGNKKTVGKEFLAKLFYLFQSSQKLDLADNILTSWSQVLLFISDPAIIYPKEWPDSIISTIVTWKDENRDKIDLFIKKWGHGIRDILKSDKTWNESYKLIDSISESNALGKYTNNYVNLVESLRNKVLTAFDDLESILSTIPADSQIPLYAFNYAAFKISKDRSLGQKSVEMVQKLHWDKNKTSLCVNKMLKEDIKRDCTLKELIPTAKLEYVEGTDIEPGRVVVSDGDISYPDKMVISALNRVYYINGKRTTYIEYLIKYFEERRDLFLNSMSFNIYKLNGSVNPNALINQFYLFLLGTNFLRHLMLDLSVKEPYVDGKAQASVEEEVADRTKGGAKRNNTHTATLKQFTMEMPNGVRAKTKLAVMEDVSGGVFNAIGTERSVDEWDGLGVVSPLQSRMESASLGHPHNVSVKKTFITPVHDFYSEELKWASNEMSNYLIKNSQGSEIPLENVFKRMHDIPFDWDITKWWNKENGGVIDIFFTLKGNNLYTRDGDTYYRLDKIESLKDGRYFIYRSKLDYRGVLSEDPVLPKEVTINSIYDLYTALGGINCCEWKKNKFVDSEKIFDFIYQVAIYAGQFKESYKGGPVRLSDLYQPVADSFIGILATNSANKRGAANINPKEAWYNPYPLYFTEIDLSTGGEQLNAEHEAISSRITRGTLLLLDLALKGYAADLVTDVYNAIAKAMNISSDEFAEMQEILYNNPEELHTFICTKLIKLFKADGTNIELLSLLSALQHEASSKEPPESISLPLSLIVNEVIKTIAPELNHVIKQKDAGLMGVLNGASGFVQLYNIQGRVYTFSSLTSLALYQKYEPLKDLILGISEEYQISKDEVVKIFSIFDLNATDGSETVDTFFKNQGSLDNQIRAFEALLLDSPDSIAFTILVMEDGGMDKLGVLEKRLVTSLLPGEYYYDINPITNQWEGKRVESVTQISALLKNKKWVYVNKNKPTDLLPQIREITYTDSRISGYVENEYTCFESRLHTIFSSQDENDIILANSLLAYLGLGPVENYNDMLLQQIQEDLTNFKNHIKALGFTLAPNPLPIISLLDGKIIGYNFESYFGGFNPRKRFEFLLQQRIITAYINQGRIGELIPSILHYLTLSTTSDYKKQLIGNALENGTLLELILKHPEFFFRFIPETQLKLYKDYLKQDDTFYEFKYSQLSTALIITPPIYDTLKIFGKDITEITYEDFKKASPSFYKTRTNVDFVIRGFTGLYNIVLENDLSNVEELNDKYGKPIKESELVINDKGERLTRKNGSVIYQLPKNTKYSIRRNNEGIETIILVPTSNSLEMWRDIMDLLESDKSLVSVEPFLDNVFNVKGLVTSLKKYLPKIQALNIIPSFNPMYKYIYDEVLNLGYTAEGLKLLILIMKKDLISLHQKVKNDYENKYAHSLYHSFLRSLDVIATRIPTQNMSSIMTMRAASLLDSNVNNIFVTKWQLWLQGADYDIDKAFLLFYNFDESGRFIRWSPLLKMYNGLVFNASMKLPLPTLQEITVSTDSVDPKMEILINDWISIQHGKMDLSTVYDRYNFISSGDIDTDLEVAELLIISEILNGLKLSPILYLNKNYNKTQVDRLLEVLNRHNLYKNSPEGINNFITSRMHEILNDERNATTSYKSIDVATDAFKIPLSKYKWETYEVNIDNGHTISDLTASAAVGKDGVGIGANGTKGLFTLLNYFNRAFIEDPPLTKEELINASHFNLRNLKLTYINKETGEQEVFEQWIGPISDTLLPDSQKDLYKEVLVDMGVDPSLFYLYDRDAAQNVGALLSLSVDNAKALDLDKLRATIDFFAMHINLAMLGVSPEIIINYFNSPDFDDVINGSENDLANGRTPKVNNDTFKETPELLLVYLCAQELTAFSLILSINQGIKVERLDIISLRLKCEQLWKTSIYAYKESIGKDGLFILAYDNSILDLLKLQANELLKNAKITLKDPFNFNTFLVDNKYLKAIVYAYKVMLKQYNVYDVILKAPHFLEMLRCYNDVLNASAVSTGILDFTMNLGKKLYTKEILGNNTKEYNNIEIDIADDLPMELHADMMKHLEYCYMQKTMSEFFRLVVSNFAFTYTWNNNKKQVSFVFDNDLHNFVEFVNAIIIPTLLNKYPKNEFLTGLIINDVENTKNGNQFYGFVENLKRLARKDNIGGIRLLAIQEDFNRISSIDVKTLLEDKIIFKDLLANLTIGDVFFLYDMIVKHVNSNQHSIYSLFSSMNKPGTLKMDYAKFVAQHDKNRVDLGITSEEVMASILRFKVPTTGYGILLRRELHFKDNSKNILLTYGIDDVQKYNRYFISMPLYDTTKFTKAMLEDKLKHLLFNNQLKVEIDIKCTE